MLAELKAVNILLSSEKLNANYKKVLQNNTALLIEIEQYTKDILGVSLQQRIWHYAHKNLLVGYCVTCGKPTRFINYSRGFSKRHQKQDCLNYVNAFKGHKHSQATKQLMSKNHADFTSINNPCHKMLAKYPEYRQVLSVRRKHWFERIKQDSIAWAQYVEKISTAQAAYKMNGDSIGASYKRGYHYSDKAESGRIWFRSSWEDAVADFLDSFDFVTQYSCEAKSYKFKDAQGFHKTGRCDFYIRFDNGLHGIVEVKNLFAQQKNIYRLFGQQEFFMLEHTQFIVADKRFLTYPIFKNIMLQMRQGELYVEKYIGSEIKTATAYFEKMYL